MTHVASMPSRFAPRDRWKVAVIAAVGVAALSMSIAVAVGLTSVSWSDAILGSSRSADAEILWRIRVPRVGLAFVSGAALAVGGLAFQAVFRNALATPYTLGVSSGASVGAALYMKSGFEFSVAHVPGLTMAAWLGSVAVTIVVFGVARSSRGFSSSTLLLVGVAVAFFCSSIIAGIQYVGDVTTSFRVGRWLMGGFEIVGFAPLRQLLPFAVLGCLVVLAARRELDLLAIGDDYASSRGVDTGRSKSRLLVAVSLMVGSVVAVCGPIGFVGVIVPHVARLIVGPRHGPLIALSLIGGGAFLVVCDTIARTVLAPVEIPVGIVTSLIGGPFFVLLLLRGRTAMEEVRGGV